MMGLTFKSIINKTLLLDHFLYECLSNGSEVGPSLSKHCTSACVGLVESTGCLFSEVHTAV